MANVIKYNIIIKNENDTLLDMHLTESGLRMLSVWNSLVNTCKSENEVKTDITLYNIPPINDIPLKEEKALIVEKKHYNKLQEFIEAFQNFNSEKHAARYYKRWEERFPAKLDDDQEKRESRKNEWYKQSRELIRKYLRSNFDDKENDELSKAFDYETVANDGVHNRLEIQNRKIILERVFEKKKDLIAFENFVKSLKNPDELSDDNLDDVGLLDMLVIADYLGVRSMYLLLTFETSMRMVQSKFKDLEKKFGITNEWLKMETPEPGETKEQKDAREKRNAEKKHEHGFWCNLIKEKVNYPHDTPEWFNNEVINYIPKDDDIERYFLCDDKEEDKVMSDANVTSSSTD